MLAEAHLSAIVQSSDDAIISKTLDGTVVSWNPAATRIFGWTEGEMVGQSIRTIIPADRQDEEDDILARIGRGERVRSFETVRQRKDGGLLHVSLTVSPILDPGGRIIGASKIARDVTDRHAAQAAHDESELKFRMLADNISQLAWIASPDGALTWYNQRWYDYTGTAFEQMQGWGWAAVHHPEHLDRVRDHFSACIAAGTEWEDTFPLRGADGRFRWFLSRAKPIRDEGGAIVNWFGTNTDVTELLEKEEQIRSLMMEVNHRSKNMLSVVQALVRRSGGNDAAFLERFENRLASLSANQDLLVRRGWAAIPIGELVEAQLATVGRQARSHVHARGPAFDLSPRSAEIIGMALHELATNALKYGALSRPEGQVSLAWQSLPGDRLVIEWREAGGPRLNGPPQAPGFGTTLIHHIPARSLKADVVLAYEPAGLVWRLECDGAIARSLAN
ncbi:PAS domain S-box protein [Novosphingobium huizhouense]|uniref:PAS domain S-box protein n=1 Tax=Novosphingobium huizhouense TaxID=2866625 RepID=UPI001CD8FD7F|nr:PAS domain S-box protein [Novosphingobium huizhouense]